MNDQTSDETKLNITISEQIALPARGTERRLAIRQSDWSRIQRRMKSAKQPLPWLQIAYSILFGISATAAVSIVSVVQANGLAAWVTPGYIIGTIAALVLALIVLALDVKTNSQVVSEIEDCIDDMAEIEASLRVVNS